MVRKGNGGNGNFAERLVSLIEGADDASIWRELAQELRNRPKDESYIVRQERFLRVAKAMREAGVLSDDKAFYMIAHPIISIAEDRVLISGAHPALEAISEKIRRVKRARGISEDEDWPRGEGPREYQELDEEWRRVYDAVFAATFEEYGEPELAALYRQEYEKFAQQYEKGRRTFGGKRDQR